MIETFLRPGVENNPQLWFQQDGATAHTARPTVALLHKTFCVYLILTRPPCSLDLTALDFFLWGYLKGKVYANKPRTIQELKANIREKVKENALERARQIEANNGHHSKDIIFKT